MRCPFCHDLENRVVDSRLGKEGDAVRRRRIASPSLPSRESTTRFSRSWQKGQRTAAYPTRAG